MTNEELTAQETFKANFELFYAEDTSVRQRAEAAKQVAMALRFGSENPTVKAVANLLNEEAYSAAAKLEAADQARKSDACSVNEMMRKVDRPEAKPFRTGVSLSRSSEVRENLAAFNENWQRVVGLMRVVDVAAEDDELGLG